MDAPTCTEEQGVKNRTNASVVPHRYTEGKTAQSANYACGQTTTAMYVDEEEKVMSVYQQTRDTRLRQQPADRQVYHRDLSSSVVYRRYNYCTITQNTRLLLITIMCVACEYTNADIYTHPRFLGAG